MRQLAVTGLLAVALFGCSDGSPTETTVGTRTYLMGFAGIPPRLDIAVLLQSIDLWSQRAELAIVHEELPWVDLLAGVSPDTIVRREKQELVNYYRGKGLKLVFIADPTDGLARDKDAFHLRLAGRSMTEPAVQRLYRDYVSAFVRILHPEYVGLAAETNLVRATAPPALYQAVVQVANDAASDVRAIAPTVPLLVSVQVDVAWGKLTASGAYEGIAADLRDFPFVGLVGLSSYPYFAFSDPDQIPADYYSRLVSGTTLPVMVTEGGWASASGGGFTSTPAKQARYLAKHAQLLDRAGAIGYLQLTFTDIDPSEFGDGDPGGILPLFASLGLVDVNLVPKPALAVWDSLYGLRRR
ncbi:MAG: hypothetical protein ABI647_22390 [Gemmatimonadota bacterium]